MTFKLTSYGLVLKLLDRLENISDFPTAPRSFVIKYAKETWKIVNTLEKYRKLTATQKIIIEEIKKKLLAIPYQVNENKDKTEGILMKVQKTKAKQIGDKIGIDWKKISLEEFHEGINVEVEHGDRDKQTDIFKASDKDSLVNFGKIALAHLKEMNDYYKRLKKMEKSGDKDKDKNMEKKKELNEALVNRMKSLAGINARKKSQESLTEMKKPDWNRARDNMRRRLYDKVEGMYTSFYAIEEWMNENENKLTQVNSSEYAVALKKEIAKQKNVLKDIRNKIEQEKYNVVTSPRYRKILEKIVKSERSLLEKFFFWGDTDIEKRRKIKTGHDVSRRGMANLELLLNKMELKIDDYIDLSKEYQNFINGNLTESKGKKNLKNEIMLYLDQHYDRSWADDRVKDAIYDWAENQKWYDEDMTPPEIFDKYNKYGNGEAESEVVDEITNAITSIFPNAKEVLIDEIIQEFYRGDL